MKINIKTIGIVNQGSIGSKYLSLLQKKYPKIKINIYTSQKLKKNNNIKIFSNFKKFTNSSLDAAIICSPANLHVKHMIELAKKKVHILVEKPLSNSLRNTEKLLSIIKKYNLVLMVGYLLRNDNGLKKIKKLIKKKIFGKFLSATVECRSYLPNWRNKDYEKCVSAQKKLGGGVLLELSHEIDYIENLFGEIKLYNSISYNSKSLNIDVEDNALINFLTKNGYVVNLMMDFSSENLIRKTIVRGDKGEIIWDNIKDKVYLQTGGKKKYFKFTSNKKKLLEIQLKNFFNQIYNKKFNNNFKEIKLLKKILKLKKNILKKF